MKSIISCKKDNLGGHSFYINHQGKEYYLFSQNYHQSVNTLFSNGVSILKVFDFKIAKGNYNVKKTISKMRMYIRYIEKEYDLKILNKTLNKGIINKKKTKTNFNKLNYIY